MARVNPVREYHSFVLVLLAALSFAGYFLLSTRQSSTLPTYFWALLSFIMICRIPHDSLRQVKASSTLMLLLVWLAYVLLSLIFSSPSSTTLSIILDIVVLVLVSISFLHMPKRLDVVNLLCSTLLVSGGASALVLLLSEVGGIEIIELGTWNVASVGSIAFGFLVLLAFSLAVKDRKGPRGILCASVALVCLAAVFHLDSHAVFFALLVSLTALSFFAVWEYRKNKLSIPLVMLSGSLMILALQVFNVLVEEQRMDIWAATISASFDGELVLGAGYAGHLPSSLLCDAAQVSEGHNCEFQHPHNLFASVVYQLGIVGLLGLMGLYVAALGSLFERKSSYRWLIGGCLFYSAAIFMFDGSRIVSNMDFVWLVFWLPIFFVIMEEAR